MYAHGSTQQNFEQKQHQADVAQASYTKAKADFDAFLKAI
jgi:hypothetical protein